MGAASIREIICELQRTHTTTRDVNETRAIAQSSRSSLAKSVFRVFESRRFPRTGDHNSTKTPRGQLARHACTSTVLEFLHTNNLFQFIHRKFSLALVVKQTLVPSKKIWRQSLSYHEMRVPNSHWWCPMGECLLTREATALTSENGSMAGSQDKSWRLLILH